MWRCDPDVTPLRRSKRLKTTTRYGIITIYTYDGAGRILSVARQGTDSSVVLVEGSSFDTAGRLLTRTNALGQFTSFSETTISNQTVKVTINPDFSTMTNLYGRDGSLLESSGTAAHRCAICMASHMIQNTVASSRKSGLLPTAALTNGSNFSLILLEGCTRNSIPRRPGLT